MAKMCEAFADAGVDVEFVVPWRLTKLKRDPFEYYGIKRNFKITKIPCLDLVRIIPWFGFWAQSLSFALFSVFRFLRVPRGGVVIYTREFLLAFVFKKIGFYTVYESHRILLKKKLYFWFIKNSDKIVTNSIGVAEEFKKRSFNYVLPCSNGVDLNEFDFDFGKSALRGELGLPAEKKIIMYTGYLYKWKGIDTVFDSARILSEDPNIVFVLVGGSESDVKKCEKKARSEGVGNILILGHKNKKEMPRYLKSADALILPNSPVSEESTRYTSPMKLFEYMASEVPIVASDLPSIREILNEHNSVLVEPDSAKQLVDGIKKVLQERDFSDSISMRARLDVQNYTWGKRAAKILEFLAI
ncbi:MAG: glycosyltransferase family 4 protein [bacterium]|nr:glycosyltransferase family 4 protein [bacterium]